MLKLVNIYKRLKHTLQIKLYIPTSSAKLPSDFITLQCGIALRLSFSNLTMLCQINLFLGCNPH